MTYWICIEIARAQTQFIVSQAGASEQNDQRAAIKIAKVRDNSALIKANENVRRKSATMTLRVMSFEWFYNREIWAPCIKNDCIFILVLWLLLNRNDFKRADIGNLNEIPQEPHIVLFGICTGRESAGGSSILCRRLAKMAQREYIDESITLFIHEVLWFLIAHAAADVWRCERLLSSTRETWKWTNHPVRIRFGGWLLLRSQSLDGIAYVRTLA